MTEVDTLPETAEAGLPEVSQEMALTTTSNDVAPPAEKKVKKIIRRKKRPARPQIDPALIKSEPPPQTGTVFNIWYVGPSRTQCAALKTDIVAGITNGVVAIARAHISPKRRRKGGA